MRLALGCILVLSAAPAHADDVLRPATPVLDRPTLTALGVQWPISGDDNFNATVTVKYRIAGTSSFKDALPLHRVHPETVNGRTVVPQFAGSVFDLRPGTMYEIQLHAVDPDGPVDLTMSLTGVTRSVPRDPQAPRAVNVTDATSLSGALNAAQPGDVITLADGTYRGPFTMAQSGTADSPIVIRGTSQAGTILDGGGCNPCNVLEIYGSFVHLEKLTIQNGDRALRFQNMGTQGNVVRRVKIENVRLGIGSQPNQLDSYLCDNVLHGRLSWPQVYSDDGGAHANDDGIHVEGFGHVICHNEIRGFGDAMKTEQDGARAVDFYGNEVLSAYDNGVELDGSEGNTRVLRNRFTNTYATLSFQPIYGGPVYAIRNIVVNVANEQMKFHGLGVTPPPEPSGVYAYHNTFVSPAHALNLQTTAASHYFAIENNLFIGPASPQNGITVDWSGVIDHGVFDYDAYLPQGQFRFDLGGTYRTFQNFAALQAAGLEMHGLLLDATPLANGLVPPASYMMTFDPQDVTLAAGSPPVDKGLVLPNVNDGYTGAAPDLGALEAGCALPIYGPRPEGTDESNEPFGCDSGSAGTGGSGGSGGSGTGGSGANGAASSTEGGCGCEVGGRAPLSLGCLALLLLFVRRRR